MPSEAEHWLSRNLNETFQLPPAAVEWLMAMWNAIQVFDDMADGDFPDRDCLETAICDTLCNMPANLFFRQYQQALIPVIAVAILKWRGSDDVERAGQPNEVSFVWRAGFYDLVLAATQLVHGRERAMEVASAALRLYGEDYAAYKAEYTDA